LLAAIKIKRAEIRRDQIGEVFIFVGGPVQVSYLRQSATKYSVGKPPVSTLSCFAIRLPYEQLTSIKTACYSDCAWII
jgi:hypothetical protein